MIDIIRESRVLLYSNSRAGIQKLCIDVPIVRSFRENCEKGDTEGFHVVSAVSQRCGQSLESIR